VKEQRRRELLNGYRKEKEESNVRNKGNYLQLHVLWAVEIVGRNGSPHCVFPANCGLSGLRKEFIL